MSDNRDYRNRVFNVMAGAMRAGIDKGIARVLRVVVERSGMVCSPVPARAGLVTASNCHLVPCRGPALSHSSGIFRDIEQENLIW